MSEDLTWAPAWRIRELVAAREVSPVEVAEHVLGRIEKLDPTLLSMVNVVPEHVREQARAAEAAVMAGRELGPLHGVPMAVKHHIDIAGSSGPGFPFWLDVARRDDLTVERLRAAGAVIVGHNTMMAMNNQGAFLWDELARNPWDPSRVAGGSTSGGAASVAAGILPVVLGSDGAGSARMPPAYNGLVGVHPTAGLVPWMDHRRWAVRPGTTIGPIARDVRDAATVLAVIAGPDGRDHLGIGFDMPDPRSELDRGAGGLRLAWTDDFGFARPYWVEESPRVVAHIRDAAFGVAGLGATVEQTDETWEDYVAALNTHRTVFSDMPILGPEAGTKVSQDAWEAATDLRQRNWLKFRALFGNYDLLLCPTIATVAPPFDVWKTRLSAPTRLADGVLGIDGFAIYTAQFNWLRLPAVSVCCGFVDGLPVGLQIVGPPGSDPKILRLARAFQQAFPHDERPQIS
ncbi:Amidase [Parafrankia sp. EAN1pec]|uniref:amidase n=1 Tax=Parafrankia sp. (strain EAN1pec) TaxID=298653 RepID=UPI000054505A|nr:Amidase [Frankia sp. EAN1pec]